MKVPFPFRLLLGSLAFLLPASLHAIPDVFSTGVVQGGGNLAGARVKEDWTVAFLDPARWEKANLPGEWRKAETWGATRDTVTSSATSPQIFGHHPLAILAAGDEEGRLKRVSLVFLEAGVFFGYVPTSELAARKDEIRAKQSEFKKIYRDTSEAVLENLQELADDRGDKVIVGENRALQSSYLDFEHGPFTIRYAATENRSLSLLITRTEDLPTSFVDTEIAGMDDRQREAYFEAQVKEGLGGDLLLQGMPVFPQGARPYCGVSTLTMATHYLGLRLSADYLASRGGFKNTGSAVGSDLLDLYKSAADEAGAQVQRSSSFDLKRAQRTLENGLPVVVWRRFSGERDRIHSRATAPGQLPEPDADDRATWANKEAPGHASVLVGLNPEAKEAILLESWGSGRTRRMRVEELEATCYMTFYFKL